MSDKKRITDIKLTDEYVKFVQPPDDLKKKAGSGGINPDLLNRAEEILKENDVDFLPYAEEYLRKIKQFLKEVTDRGIKDKNADSMRYLVRNIMLLKAHGGMFHYMSMTKISDLVLDFIERTEIMNDDLFKIIEAHNDSIEIIISKQIKDENGTEEMAIINELQSAISRFNKKYSK